MLKLKKSFFGAEGIKLALKNPYFSGSLLRQADYDVQRYGWINRVKKIVNFINNE